MLGSILRLQEKGFMPSLMSFLSYDTLEKTVIDTRGHIGGRCSKLDHPPTNHSNKMNLSMPQNGGSLLALLPRSYFILPILNAVNSDRQLPSSSFSLPSSRSCHLAECSGIDGLLYFTCIYACMYMAMTLYRTSLRSS